MDFIIKNLQKSVVTVSREIGYVVIDTAPSGQYNLVRRLDRDNYPRFHVYLKQQGIDFIFSLHLDQKKPVYRGAHAHSGEYFGPVVEGEADRIKSIL
ncbi:hypothetical protein A2819_00010 [Candidatus Azambacteria bacterium RIFCSPHIGHO2_01_FULL_40_24]|uniref:Uncharacterized protein n=1 Tax=Candidatus Azambacteria bacterium RIFCSPHIGHO2_01_FULL_40_24 TaxID=1797301 RepID=A0A1F5B1U1_9BACT|nr:MAG: hypothetical protein A2819_00010 [Candidatus Azambacteria bacterium RIFCSPHIGHO2_01_FULL_40_24]